MAKIRLLFCSMADLTLLNTAFARGEMRGDKVYSARIPGMASGKTAKGQPAAAQNPVAHDSFHGIG